MEEKSKISTIVNFDDVFHELPDIDFFNIWRRTLNSTEERDAPEKCLFTVHLFNQATSEEARLSLVYHAGGFTLHISCRKSTELN